MHEQLYDIFSDLIEIKMQLEGLIFTTNLFEKVFESSEQTDAFYCAQIFKIILEKIFSNYDSTLETIDKIIIKSK